jgi:hypothetical protein
MADSFLARWRLRARTKVSVPWERKLDAHARVAGDLLPVAGKQFALKVGEFAPRSAHQIIGSSLPKILQVIFADHPAIKHPHPALHSVLILDLGNDLFESAHVGRVPVENLVGHGEALRSHHQRDDDLQGVRTMVTGVAARSGFHPDSFSFKIGARQIVEQDLTFGSKEVTPALLEMAHQRIAVFERLVQSPIETVLASHSLITSQKEIHGRARKPSLVDAQLAARSTEPINRQELDDLGPFHRSTPISEGFEPKLIKTHLLP